MVDSLLQGSLPGRRRFVGGVASDFRKDRLTTEPPCSLGENAPRKGLRLSVRRGGAETAPKLTR